MAWASEVAEELTRERASKVAPLVVSFMVRCRRALKRSLLYAVLKLKSKERVETR